MTKLGKNLEIIEIQPMDVCRRAVAHKTTDGWKNAPRSEERRVGKACNIGWSAEE